MRTLIPTILSILITGCTIQQSHNYYLPTVQTWLGASTKALESRWGSPDDKINGTHCDIIYIYKTESQQSYRTDLAPTVAMTVTPSGRPFVTHQPGGSTPVAKSVVTDVCYAVFKANRHGRIYAVEVQGKHCIGNLNFAATMANPSK